MMAILITEWEFIKHGKSNKISMRMVQSTNRFGICRWPFFDYSHQKQIEINGTLTAVYFSMMSLLALHD
jgi:hypothetical protein